MHSDRERECDKYARTNPQRNGNPTLIHNLRFRTTHGGTSTLVSELLPLGCLSILRQQENGFLDQERSQSRENTSCGKKRDTDASWFAKQNTVSPLRLDNRADHRTFLCVTQPEIELEQICPNHRHFLLLLLSYESHHLQFMITVGSFDFRIVSCSPESNHFCSSCEVKPLSPQ